VHHMKCAQPWQSGASSAAYSAQEIWGFQPLC
jgi:hypothetical protein